MSADLISLPFADQGDKQSVPVTDPNGFVNVTEGYTKYYEISLASGDPQAKGVERNVQNYLFNLITSNLQVWQQGGLPPWYSNMPGGYPVNALVFRAGSDGIPNPYRSTAAGNITDPLTSNTWEYQPTAAVAKMNVPMPSGGSAGPAAAVIAAAVDLNTLVAPATFEIQSDAVVAACQNLPGAVAKTALAGMLEIMVWPNGATTYTIQRYVDRTGQVFVRGATNGAWTAWQGTITDKGGQMSGPLVLFAGSTASTPAQFDSSKQVATTEALMIQQGNFRSARTISANTALGVADIGLRVIAAAVSSAITVTVPDMTTLPVGSTFFLDNLSGRVVTLAPKNSSDLFLSTFDTTNTAKSFTIPANGSVSVTKVGGSIWLVAGTGDFMKSAFAAQLGVADAGFQKLPSGLIIQWGAIATASSGVGFVSLPTAFPSVNAVQIGSTGSVSDITNAYAVGIAATVTTTSFQVVLNSAAVARVAWLAVGY